MLKVGYKKTHSNIPKLKIKINWFMLINYKLHMALFHCNNTIFKGIYYFQRDSEAVFGINIVIWGFTICLLFRDPKIKFWKKMLKKVISANWGLVKISPKITKNAKWNNIWPKSKVRVHKTDRYGSYEIVNNNIWEFYQVLKNIYGKWR